MDPLQRNRTTQQRGYRGAGARPPSPSSGAAETARDHAWLERGHQEVVAIDFGAPKGGGPRRLAGGCGLFVSRPPPRQGRRAPSPTFAPPADSHTAAAAPRPRRS